MRGQDRMKTEVNRPDNIVDATLTAKEFKTLADLVFQYTGIKMDDRRVSLMAGRLARRLSLLRLSDYSEYIDYLTADPWARSARYS